MAGAAGGIADLETEQSGLGLLKAVCLHGSGQHGIQGCGEQAVDQLLRRVIRARGLALIAGGRAQIKPVACYFRMQLQQGFINGAQLHGAQMAPVHRPSLAVQLRKGQLPHGGEQIIIGQFQAGNVRHGLGGPQKAAHGRKPQKLAGMGIAAAQGSHDKFYALPEIMIFAAMDAGGQTPQAAQGPIVAIGLPGGRRGFRAMQQLPLLHHQQKNKTVGQAQQLPEIALAGDVACGQPMAQGRICGHESLAEHADGGGDIAAQFLKRCHRGIVGIPAPALQPALLWRDIVAMHPGMVAAQPQQGELGEGFALKYALQVEFHIGLAAQAGIVAQNAQAQAIGHKTPEMDIGAVEKFLDQGVRVLGGCAGNSRAPFVQGHMAAHQVNGRFIAKMRDGVAFAAGNLPLLGSGQGQMPIIQLPEQGQKKILAGEASAGLARGEILHLAGKIAPYGQHLLPGAVYGLIQTLPQQMIVAGAKTGQAPLENAGQGIAGQKRTLAMDIGEKGGFFHASHIACAKTGK